MKLKTFALFIATLFFSVSTFAFGGVAFAAVDEQAWEYFEERTISTYSCGDNLSGIPFCTAEFLEECLKVDPVDSLEAFSSAQDWIDTCSVKVAEEGYLCYPIVDNNVAGSYCYDFLMFET